jgi:YYY domain-containing protein
MFQLLQMWAMIEVLGLVCLPLTITVFHNLPDRGWAFSKTLALALFAFCVWFPLMCLQFLPFSQLFIAGVALILLACNLIAFLRIRHSLFKVIRSNLTYIIMAEVVFLGMVFLLGWLRSYGPGIQSYETFMDEGFIAGIMRSPHLPPNDMWFAGYPINYYYYAHFTVAMLAKLLGQSPSIAFNTGICMFFGLTAANLFGVTCNIVSWAGYVRTRAQTQDATARIERSDTLYLPLWRSIPYGLLSMIMGLVLGNLAATQTWWQEHDTTFANAVALQQWLHNFSGWSQYDWFSGPTRVIDNTINEFPAFSFLISCFHAHVLTLAFTILAMGMAFNLFLEADGKGIFVFGRGWRLVPTLFMTALVLGGLFTMNGWDYPTYLGLALLCIVLQQWLAHGARFSMELCLDILTAGLSLGVLSFALYLPFYRGFVSPAQGIGIVSAADRSPLRDELLIYGLFAFVFLSLLLASALKSPLFPLSSLMKKKDKEDEEDEKDEARFNWQRVGVIGAVLLFLVGLVTLVVMRNGATFVIATSISVLALVLLFYNIGNRAHAFVLLLGATAFALVAVCEVVFLKDVFAGSLPRMNTVFKLYFQAWAMLSIGCGAGLFFILESFRPVQTASRAFSYLQRGGRVVWIVCLLILILAGAVYPLSAPEARYATLNANGQPTLQRTNSLDGLTYLATDPANPGDYDAIRWLNANVQGDPVIVEAVGDDYSNAGRVSAFTGLPTPMGWIGHEVQWRINWLNQPGMAAEFQRRGSDVATIYTSSDSATVLSLLAHYNAQYLYVGPVEYAKYPNANLHRFSAFMQVVYNAEGVTIYKVR